MTNQEIRRIAMEQSAIDLACRWEDFEAEKNRIVLSKQAEGARKYLVLPFACNLVSYGNNIVASVSENLQEIVRSYIEKYPVEHCFETPNMNVLQEALLPYGFKICFMAEYFLPDMACFTQENKQAMECPYETRILQQADFEGLYVPAWSNALCEDRKQLDVLGIAAYDKGKMIGMAGCSADCERMWQIGIDVLPEYRRQGIAAFLTKKLAMEILDREKVPFYCAAWSNIKSVRNAIKSGFRPAWVEMTAKSADFVEQLNR